MIFLDTNIMSYALKKRPSPVAARITQALRAGPVAVSVIVYAELYFGASLSQRRKQLESDLAELFESIEVEPWSLHAAHFYADLRADLTRNGTLIGPLDMLIAAHALSHDATLVTNNEREFSHIPGLKIENWT